jgi:hypothetical protein
MGFILLWDFRAIHTVISEGILMGRSYRTDENTDEP